MCSEGLREDTSAMASCNITKCCYYGSDYDVLNLRKSYRRLVVGFPPRRHRFEPGSLYVRFLVHKVALGQFISEYFDFPFITPTVPQSPSSIIWGWGNRPLMAAVPSGSSLTPPRIILKNM
jgi:hypothetical protein